jgi:hypothetical protein
VGDLLSKLLEPRLGEATVPVEGVGEVHVRGISREEMWLIRAADTAAPGSFELHLLRYGVIDPALGLDDAAAWQRAARPGEIAAVVDKINELSALASDSAKAAYKEFEADPDAEFRALPSPGTVDDGGSPTAGDAE